jgi:hypothetical protein
MDTLGPGSLDARTDGAQHANKMWNRVACVVAWIAFTTLMALRGETSSFAARLVMGAIAFSVGGVALSYVARSRAIRRQRDQPDEITS